MINFVEVQADFSCDPNYVPSALQLIESLNTFEISLLSVGSILSILTLYFTVDACHNILSQKESIFYKANAIVILFVYPVVSVCSLTAIAIPRGQLLSEAVIQIFLNISLYRLYLLLLDIGDRKINETPTLMLRVGPCCCWPCLPFPNLSMTETNLSWIGILALQLPIVQGIIYFVLLFIAVEEPIIVMNYYLYLQPIMILSIFLGMYSLTIVTKTLHSIVPEAKLRYKMLVSQLVLMFTKLQFGIIKSLSGLFPCNPPVTPTIYAYVTFNSLILIEMLLLCYFARRIYYVDLENKQGTDAIDYTGTSNQAETSSNETNKQQQLPATIA